MERTEGDFDDADVRSPEKNHAEEDHIDFADTQFHADVF